MPLLGVAGCLGAMIVIDPVVTVVALLGVIVVLAWLFRRDVARPVTDIRRGILVALAQWARRTAQRIPSSDERTWSPRLLVPLRHGADLDRAASWLPILAPVGGTCRLVAMSAEELDDRFHDDIQRLGEQLDELGVTASTATLEVAEAARGPGVALTAIGDEQDPQSANVVVAGFPEDREHERASRRLLRDAFDADVGVVLLPPRAPEFTEDGPGISLWVSARGPSWQLGRHLPHSDLALLISYRLARRLEVPLALATAVRRSQDVESAEGYLEEIAETARLPGPPEIRVRSGSLEEALRDAPPASLHVFGMTTQVDFDWLGEVQDTLSAPCLFIRDSGVENAFA